LEYLDRVGVPSKVCTESELVAEILPAAPRRVSVFLGGTNSGAKFPRLCSAEVTEISVPGAGWNSVQG
jgi:hypothetical protein